MEERKRPCSLEEKPENVNDLKRVKFEQVPEASVFVEVPKVPEVPVFVEVPESHEDSFCLPDTHLRLKTYPNLDDSSFQCDICKKNFKFFLRSLNIQ